MNSRAGQGPAPTLLLTDSDIPFTHTHNNSSIS
jgi:hypothetical protein